MPLSLKKLIPGSMSDNRGKLTKARGKSEFRTIKRFKERIRV